MLSRYIKPVFLLFSLLFLSGCSVEYNLVITDSDIQERIVFSNDSIFINDNVLSTIRDDYGSYYTIDYDYDPPECFDDVCPEYIDYMFLASNSYSDFDHFNNSKAISDFFGDFKVSQNKNVFFITATPREQLSNIVNDVNYSKAAVDNILVNITLPYKVIENNADKVNGNVYTWLYNKDTANKVLTISYDTSVSFSNNNSGDSDLESGIDIDNNTNNSDNNLNIKDDGINYFLVIGTLVVVILISVFIYFKMKKNDNL